MPILFKIINKIKFQILRAALSIFLIFIQRLDNNSHFENERRPYFFIGKPLLLFFNKHLCYNDDKSYNIVFNHTRTARL